jgi:putative membrane protein
MHIVVIILIALIALLHLYFLWFEMFAWTTRGPKIFKSFPKDLFEPTKSLAANKKIFYIQAMPAILALILLHLL